MEENYIFCLYSITFWSYYPVHMTPKEICQTSRTMAAVKELMPSKIIADVFSSEISIHDRISGMLSSSLTDCERNRGVFAFDV